MEINVSKEKISRHDTEEYTSACEQIAIPRDSIILISGVMPGTGSSSTMRLIACRNS